METVLVFGASGNIGVSTIIAALHSGRKVLAVVRNKAAEGKIATDVGAKDGITFAHAEVTDEQSVKKVIDRVKAGELPSFQHVYSAVGILELAGPIHTLDMEIFRKVMKIAFDSNFFAYRATIPHLLEQAIPKSTWTLITGGAGEVGYASATAISQGALFSLANVACRELAETNIRFNEVLLKARVEYDSDAEKNGAMKASTFGRTYEGILANEKIRECRVTVEKEADVDKLQYKKKLG